MTIIERELPRSLRRARGAARSARVTRAELNAAFNCGMPVAKKIVTGKLLAIQHRELRSYVLAVRYLLEWALEHP